MLLQELEDQITTGQFPPYKYFDDTRTFVKSLFTYNPAFVHTARTRGMYPSIAKYTHRMASGGLAGADYKNKLLEEMFFANISEQKIWDIVSGGELVVCAGFREDVLHRMVFSTKGMHCTTIDPIVAKYYATHYKYEKNGFIIVFKIEPKNIKWSFLSLMYDTDCFWELEIVTGRLKEKDVVRLYSDGVEGRELHSWERKLFQLDNEWVCAYETDDRIVRTFARA